MKCVVRDNRLIVRGVFRTRFRASPSDLTEVKVMASKNNYPPPFFPWFLGRKIARLRFIMLRTDDSEFTVDMRADTGTSEVIRWLKDAGWDIDAAVQEAMQVPLVRAIVQRARPY